MKRFNPINNSMRSLSLIERDCLAKRPAPQAKHLIVGRKRTSARNSDGRITIWCRGGGHKKRLRIVDFKRYSVLGKKSDGECTKVFSEVISIEYDPNRSAFLALLSSKTNLNDNDVFYHYVIASHSMKIGTLLICSNTSTGMDQKEGNCFPLSKISIGSKIHCIELKHGSGAVMARSAGAYAELLSRDEGYALLKLRSGEKRLVPENCYATIGIVSNIEHKNESLAKAGRNRWKGIRPHVRGVAMNPIDHPHGGGEGKTSGGRHPVTPWGKPTKGKKTRHKKWSDKLIKSF